MSIISAIPQRLAQSSQLYKQIMVGVNERVFALMPFFRAENSHTTRHLTEGKQFEFEMGFFDDWRQVMDIQEGCIKFMIKSLHNHCAAEIKALVEIVIKAPENVPSRGLLLQKPRSSISNEQASMSEKNRISALPQKKNFAAGQPKKRGLIWCS